MTCRERLERYFRENGVKYQVQSHPEVYTAQEVAAVEHVPGRLMAKVVMAMIDGALTALVLPAPHRVEMPKLKAALGAKEARGARRRGFVVPVPHTRSGQKHVQTYIQTLRPMVADIAATLLVDRAALTELDDPDEIGAAYLGAFLDDLERRLAG